MKRTIFPVSNGVFPWIDNTTILEKAFHEGKLITQASDGMLMMTQLSAIAVALQGSINVEIPTGKISPVSLMALTIADSGERKSTVDNLFMKGVKDFQKEKEDAYTPLIKKYNVLVSIHEEITRKIKRKLFADDIDDGDDIIDELIEHTDNYPEKPKSPRIFYEDSTEEALLIGLYENSPNAFLGSSEGGVLLKSRIMSNTATINALWSGDEVTVTRKTAESFQLSDVRLSVHIMAQNSAIQRFLDKSQDDVRGNGFLSRMLVCAPEPTCGHRYSNGLKHETEAITDFNNRLRELLEMTSEMNSFKDRKVVVFSAEAKNIWLDIYNDIESKMAPGFMYHYATDHASKLADNVARVAALIHYFEYPFDTEISVDSLWKSISLLSYFSNEFLRIFCPAPEHVVDAMELGYWFDSLLNGGFRYIRKNYIRQYGPNRIRSKARLEAALNHFKMTSSLAEFNFKKTKVIDLNRNIQYDYYKMVSDLDALS